MRFQFPRPPVRETIAAKPSEPPSKSVKQLYINTLTAVQEQLEGLDTRQEMSLDKLLDNAKVTEELYINAPTWIKTKNGQPTILLKREPKEVNINNYNVTLMKGWEANLDVQFVTNVYSCIMYVASYVSKPEKTLGDFLKNVSASSQHLGAKASMKAIAKKFLSHREVSAQEAVYRLMSLPLTKGSRDVVFIATDLPENRTWIIKPMNLINNLEDDDPDVFQAGFLERYPMRPNNLENMCFAEFVSNYKYASTCTRNKDDTDVEEDENLPQNQSTLQKTITLKAGYGYMTLRKNSAIIRTHQWSRIKQPQQYYHALLLYVPWRNELNDLLKGSYKETFIEKAQALQQNRNKYEKLAEDVEEAIQILEENGPIEENWNVIAAQTEQARIEETLEGNEMVESVANAYDTSAERNVCRDLGVPDHQYELSAEALSTNDWYELILSLNSKQYEVHRFIVDWCSKRLLTHRVRKLQPFHIFLTGGAGV